jgi:hypothetical protein
VQALRVRGDEAHRTFWEYRDAGSGVPDYNAIVTVEPE